MEKKPDLFAASIGDQKHKNAQNRMVYAVFGWMATRRGRYRLLWIALLASKRDHIIIHQTLLDNTKGRHKHLMHQCAQIGRSWNRFNAMLHCSVMFPGQLALIHRAKLVAFEAITLDSFKLQPSNVRQVLLIIGCCCGNGVKDSCLMPGERLNCWASFCSASQEQKSV